MLLHAEVEQRSASAKTHASKNPTRRYVASSNMHATGVLLESSHILESNGKVAWCFIL